jgi:serine/threonine protein kinase
MASNKSNKYRVINVLASGRFSNVYLSQDQITQKNFIMKKINRIEHDKIFREIKILTQISHSNITNIIEYYHDDDNYYIIYPYIMHSISLADIPKSSMKQDYMTRTIYQISRALKYLHSENIIHRDVKPDNIVVSHDTATLIDFNLAAIPGDPIYDAKPGLIGTPNYIAPEIWKNYDIVDYFLADSYSFGTTMFFAFNKKRLPYNGDTIEDLEFKIRNEKPKSSMSGNNQLDTLIMHAIKRDPKIRLNMNGIHDALQILQQIKFTI